VTPQSETESESSAIDWVEVWTRFGFDRERPESPYHYRSQTQLRLALRCWDASVPNPDRAIDAAVGESLMLVEDGNGELLGYDLHPGVSLSD